MAYINKNNLQINKREINNINRKILSINNRIRVLRSHKLENTYDDYDLSQIKSYFPDINIKKLEEINQYHQTVCNELCDLIDNEIKFLNKQKVKLYNLLTPLTATARKLDEQNENNDSDEDDSNIYQPRIYPRGRHTKGLPYSIFGIQDVPQHAAAKVSPSELFNQGSLHQRHGVLYKPDRSIRCKKAKPRKYRVVRIKKDD